MRGNVIPIKKNCGTNCLLLLAVHSAISFKPKINLFLFCNLNFYVPEPNVVAMILQANIAFVIVAAAVV